MPTSKARELVNKARELVNGERARRAVRFQLATNGARAGRFATLPEGRLSYPRFAAPITAARRSRLSFDHCSADL
jgi:hypothetical protein